MPMMTVGGRISLPRIAIQRQHQCSNWVVYDSAISRYHVARSRRDLKRLCRSRQARKVAAEAQGADVAELQKPWEHVLVALVDSNPSFSTASRTALKTAAGLALEGGKLTIMFLDDQGEGTEAVESRDTETLREELLRASGVGEVNFIHESIEHSSGKGSVAIGEAADNFDADLVVMSSAVIHEKHVDANLLAEFVPSPVLLLP